MSLEASRQGRALLARMKTYIKDYAECMEAWEFIRESLQERAIKHSFAWQPPSESAGSQAEGSAATRVAIITDRSLLDFTFKGRRLECVLARLSAITGMEEVRYTEPDADGMALPVMQATMRREHPADSSVYTVRGIEEAAEFQEFLAGLRRQLLR